MNFLSYASDVHEVHGQKRLEPDLIQPNLVTLLILVRSGQWCLIPRAKALLGKNTAEIFLYGLKHKQCERGANGVIYFP